MAFGQPSIPLSRHPFIAQAHEDFESIRIALQTDLPDETVRDPVRDVLANVDIDQVCQKATGESRLFFSGPSDSMIHGPDALIAMTDLGKTLLEAGEEFVAAQEMRFRKLIQTELKIVAASADQFKPEEIRGGTATIKMVTNQRRAITIVATPLGKPVAGGKWIDRSIKTTAIYDNHAFVSSDQSEIRMSVPVKARVVMTDYERASPGFQIATYMDLVLPLGASLINSVIKMPRDFLAAGGQKVAVPDLSKLTPGSVITVALQDPFRTNGRFNFARVNTILSGPNRQEIQRGTIEIAFPGSNEVEAQLDALRTSHQYIRK